MTTASTRPRRGCDALLDTLKAAGVSRIFTLSGNHIMPVFDAAFDSGIDLVHTRHEAAAVHMADAHARITGEVGIALVTGGPGHANAISALYTALMAEAPVVLLSGHAPNGADRSRRVPGDAPGRDGRAGVQGELDLRQRRRRRRRHGARDRHRALRPARPGAPEPADRCARGRRRGAGRRVAADAFAADVRSRSTPPAPAPLPRRCRGPSGR